MTGPRVDPTTGEPAPAVMTGAQWSAAQSAPASALLEADPGKATTHGMGRTLTGSEWAQAQRMTAEQVKGWKIPALPQSSIVSPGRNYFSAVPAAPRDVTVTPNDPRAKGRALAEFDIKDPTTYANPVLRQLVNPVLEHPFASAAVGAAPFALPGILGTAAAVGVAGAGVYHIAQYGWQKAAELSLPEDLRKLAEADPDRVSGESAAAQAIMLGLAPLVHVGIRGGGRLTDFGAGMTEAGASGIRDVGGGRLFSPETIQGASEAAATSRFAAGLEQGADARAGVELKVPKGFEPTATPARSGARAKRVEGLDVPESATPGRVKPIETQPASAGLEEAGAVDAAVREYGAQRVAEDTQDIAAQRLADAERVLGLREPEPDMSVRRRPGGAKPEPSETSPAPFFETTTGAQTLGATAARHGMAAEANPYHPNSPLASEWSAGHQAATESYPLYPEGFAMGGAESRIPGASELPRRARGTSPAELPEGATPESAQLAAALRPSRFRGHTVDELVAETRQARETIDHAQTRLDEHIEHGGEPVRGADGNLRRDLSLVATDALEAEQQRLTELNAAEEHAHAAVQEAGYRADYLELPKTERLGHKGKEDLPDADGAVDPERLAADNKIVADYNKNAPVRAARAKAIERIQKELDGRGDETAFDFGANAEGEGASAGGRGPTVLEKAITRAKGTLTQLEREFALRGITGDKLAKLLADEGVPVEGVESARPNAVRSVRETEELVGTLRAEGERRSLERAAKTDELTGLGNQRAFREALADAEADPDVSVIRFDANGFKGVNDALGHAQGDAVLARIGQVIREEAPGLPAFRAGGDEFAVFAPKTEAIAIRDAIEESVGVQDVAGEGGATARYSVSGGIGETSAEADLAAIARKAEHKAAQGIASRDGTVAPVEGAPVEGGPLATVEGTGETRTRTLAAGVNEKALANRLELGVGDLPEYRVVQMADQAKRAAALLEENPELARQVATGEAPAPRGLLPESVFVAVEQRAIAEGDVNTLRELATGRLTSEATTMGQRIRALGERDPESPVAAMQDVVRSRSGGTKNAEAVARATDAELAVIRQAIDGTQIEPGAWTSLLDALKC